MFTREEFEQWRKKSAQEMDADADLKRQAMEVFVKADRHNWIHQSNWLGEPMLNTAEDMLTLQEIIYKTRPKYIIEVGVAWGGSMLFYSTLMEVLGGGKIIGIDIYVPEDLKQRIGSHGKLSERISWINASSIEQSTVEKVKSMIGGSKEVMVILDSNHEHAHVLKELELYAPLVGQGQYLIVGDTVVESMPLQTHRPRPWGPGNNPKTAVDAFLKTTDRFVLDTELEAKLLMTCDRGGHLKCVKN